MKITYVNIYPFNTGRIGGRVRAIAEVIVEDVIVIRDIKVIENKHGGLFLSFPKKRVSGKYVDIVDIISKEFAENIRRAVVDKYKEMININLEVPSD